MAELRGAPGYRYATTPHPVAVLTADQVRERAAQVLGDVVALLAEPAMTEASPDPDAAQAAIEYCYDQGWSDGLPLVPASQPLLDQFLATTTRSPDEVIGQLEQVGRDCTVYLAAINAAMAGCLPGVLPRRAGRVRRGDAPSGPPAAAAGSPPAAPRR